MLPALALVAAACGSSTSGSATPSEDPGRAMVRLVQFELTGRRASSYSMLVSQQRAAVSHDLYVHCPPGPPRSDVRVLILGTHDELFDVPAVGKVKTKAVRYEMSIPDASGHSMTIASTGHLIAQDGHWRWTLSQSSLSALLAGACP